MPHDTTESQIRAGAGRPSHRLAVFVESNTTGNGARMLAEARRLDCRPVLLATDPARYPFAAEDHAAVIRCDTDDPRGLADLVRGLGDDIDLVCSSSDHYLTVAARVAAELDLRGPDPAAIARCQDKSRQRATLADAGVRVPSHLVAGNPTDARRAAARIGGPVVVKPVTGTGSVGVRLCHDPDAAARHAAAVLAEGTDERGRDRPALVLVEQFVGGREFSVEILQGAVVGVSETHLGPPPSFVETGHDHPAGVTAGERAAIVAAAAAATSALGLDRDTSHVEVRLDVGAASVIEVNPRLPGGRITDLVRLATGIDMVAEYLRSLTGAGQRLTPTIHRAAAIRHLTNRAVTGVGALDVRHACGYPGVVDVALERSPSDAEHGDFRDRVAHVIAVGADTPTAAARATTAVQALVGERS